MKKKYLYFVVLFFAITMLPAITWTIISRYSQYENVSNSQEESFPKFSRESFRTYTKELEEYINDKMPYKHYLVTCNGIIDYFIFNDSSSERVIAGKEGWLFYKGAMPDYERTNLYSEEELRECCNNLVEIEEYLNKQNIVFVIFIAPNKATIYGDDFLPTYIRANQENHSRMEQLTGYIQDNTKLRIVFPKEEMKKAYELYPDELQYFKKDTHWNLLGGYYGAKALLEELNIFLPDREELQLKEIEQPTYLWNKYDMANMLGMTNVLTKDTNYYIEGCLQNGVEYGQDIHTDQEAFGSFWSTKSLSSDSRKVVFIRDSFGGGMIPYIADSFAEVYSPHMDSVTLEQIEKESPDIVVLEMVERTDMLQFSLEAWDK